MPGVGVRRLEFVVMQMGSREGLATRIVSKPSREVPHICELTLGKTTLVAKCRNNANYMKDIEKQVNSGAI